MKGLLKSKPVDPLETRRRVEDALRKHESGEILTEMEQTVVYWLRHGGGCHACGGVKLLVDRRVGRSVG